MTSNLRVRAIASDHEPEWRVPQKFYVFSLAALKERESHPPVPGVSVG